MGDDIIIIIVDQYKEMIIITSVIDNIINIHKICIIDDIT